MDIGITGPALFNSEVYVSDTNSLHYHIKQKNMSISEKIDEVFEYFEFIGRELKVDESRHFELFTDDFQMIINGKVVVNGRDHLSSHFELLLTQVSALTIHLHEKVVAEDKAIMRYDIEKPGKSTSKVIAIFKFRDGLVYEMNEVVYSVDPQKEIDFTSK